MLIFYLFWYKSGLHLSSLFHFSFPFCYLRLILSLRHGWIALSSTLPLFAWMYYRKTKPEELSISQLCFPIENESIANRLLGHRRHIVGYMMTAGLWNSNGVLFLWNPAMGVAQSALPWSWNSCFSFLLQWFTNHSVGRGAQFCHLVTSEQKGMLYLVVSISAFW